MRITEQTDPCDPTNQERAMLATRKSNEQLEVEIREALGHIPSVNANGIGITADHRLVFLNGHVLGETWRVAIVEAVLRIDEVHAVVDEMKVRTSVSGAHDANLACEATAVLRESLANPNGHVKVIVRDGKVWLHRIGEGAAEKPAILASFRRVLVAQGLKMDVEFLPWPEDDSVKASVHTDRSLLPA
jgi:hypothetical protein